MDAAAAAPESPSPREGERQRSPGSGSGFPNQGGGQGERFRFHRGEGRPYRNCGRLPGPWASPPMPEAEISIATPRIKKMALKRPSAIAPMIRPAPGPVLPVALFVPTVAEADGEADGEGDGTTVGVGASVTLADWLPTSVGSTVLVPSVEVALM